MPGSKSSYPNSSSPPLGSSRVVSFSSQLTSGFRWLAEIGQGLSGGDPSGEVGALAVLVSLGVLWKWAS